MRNTRLLALSFAALVGLAGFACSVSSSDSSSETGEVDEGYAGSGGGVSGRLDAGAAYGGSGGGNLGGGTAGAYGGSGTAGTSSYADAGMGGPNGGSGAGPNDSSRPGQAADAGTDAADSGVSCSDLDQSKSEVLYLSADDSNSMASPVIARSIITKKAGAVPTSILRTYEFLNYYNVSYEPAEAGSLRIVPQMRPGAADTDFELQIGVQAPAAPSHRKPMTITLVLDTSGSMSGSPISLEKATVRAIADSLQSGDIVNAVTWSTYNTPLLKGHYVQGPHDQAVLNLADSIAAGGGTDLHGGLMAGYKLAEQHYGNDRINRVVLVSDGQANVGITDADYIASKADDQNREGIYLVGVGVGRGFNDTLMDKVTDAGNGAYVFLDSVDEAQEMFVSRFPETMQVAARDVQVKLTLPWYFQMYKFHGEEYSSDPTKVKPQYLAPGDAMVFNQVLRACDASQINPSDSIGLEASWKDPLNYADKKVTKSVTIQELLDGQDAALKRGRAIVAYAELLKLVGKNPQAVKADLFDKTLAVIDSALADSPKDPSLTEIKGLVQSYKSTIIH